MGLTHLRHQPYRHHQPIAKATRDKLKDIKGPPAPPKHGVTITRRAQGDCWTMNLHGPSKDIAEIAQHIHSTSGVIDLIHHRTTTAAENTVPDSYTQPVACGTCGAETTARQIVSGLKTNVIIRLDELVEVFFGDGDDIKLKMTNGATITGRDLCTRILADSGFITFIHPVHGPVNLYRTKRLARFKQRMMAMAEQPTCAWPGCNHPAETAQIHHLKFWKRGGNTNPDNLTVLCPYHNGINDDDNTPHRGQLTRTNGTIHYTPPWAA